MDVMFSKVANDIIEFHDLHLTHRVAASRHRHATPAALRCATSRSAVPRHLRPITSTQLRCATPPHVTLRCRFPHRRRNPPKRNHADIHYAPRATRLTTLALGGTLYRSGWGGTSQHPGWGGASYRSGWVGISYHPSWSSALHLPGWAGTS